MFLLEFFEDGEIYRNCQNDEFKEFWVKEKSDNAEKPAVLPGRYFRKRKRIEIKSSHKSTQFPQFEMFSLKNFNIFVDF